VPQLISHVLALADDLTGALEVGAKFAAQGVPAIVVNGSDLPTGTGVVVVNTESRHLPPDDAAQAVSAAAAIDAPIIYKKTDSTLRGNIGAELRALTRMYPDAQIAYVPAYPAMARTVRNGHLYVNGIPVHETSFAGDPLNPVTESSIARVVGENIPCTIFDCETSEDVTRIAFAILQESRYRILAGPAALAEAIAASIDVPRQTPSRWPIIVNCLIVNGSLHERSAQQISCAKASGVASAAEGASWRILQPVIHPSDASLDIANQTGREVRGILASTHLDAICVFGGDTASGILKALGNPHLQPLGELVEGVPISRIVGHDLHLITKAGGFGEVDVIGQLREILDENNSHALRNYDR
jgi:uncharacterized protein YgbK (DUF1537 family)